MTMIHGQFRMPSKSFASRTSFLQDPTIKTISWHVDWVRSYILEKTDFYDSIGLDILVFPAMP